MDFDIKLWFFFFVIFNNFFVIFNNFFVIFNNFFDDFLTDIIIIPKEIYKKKKDELAARKSRQFSEDEYGMLCLLCIHEFYTVAIGIAKNLKK